MNKILACVDFSTYTPLVMEYAVELAKDSNSRILVYNVINQRDIHMVELISTYATQNLSAEEYIRDLKKERQTMIKELIKTHFFEEKSSMSYRIDEGIPSEQILNTAVKEDMDLIVMANKGRGNLSRVLFGSAAEKVFRHSRIPVVSVRDRENFKRER